jgi:redox-sensitive bicupin YhaK (pirin superfamily)
VQHSEFNHAKDQQTHLLQIWIEPNVTGIEPGYEQKRFTDEEKRGKLRLVASPDGADGSVLIHADARVYAGLFDAEESASVELAAGRKSYVNLIRGKLEVNGKQLEGGDAMLIDNETRVSVSNGIAAEVLVFDLSAE